MFAVLRNVCIDRLRKPRSSPLEEAEVNRIEAPSDSYEDIKKFEALITEGLTKLQKRIYYNVTHCGKEYEEIARHLNMSVEAVRMNMSRARRKIRDNYKLLEK